MSECARTNLKADLRLPEGTVREAVGDDPQVFANDRNVGANDNKTSGNGCAVRDSDRVDGAVDSHVSFNGGVISANARDNSANHHASRTHDVTWACRAEAPRAKAGAVHANPKRAYPNAHVRRFDNRIVLVKDSAFLPNEGVHWEGARGSFANDRGIFANDRDFFANDGGKWAFCIDLKPRCLRGNCPVITQAVRSIRNAGTRIPAGAMVIGEGGQALRMRANVIRRSHRVIPEWANSVPLSV